MSSIETDATSMGQSSEALQESIPMSSSDTDVTNTDQTSARGETRDSLNEQVPAVVTHHSS
jgi:hypothetical protein